MYRLASPAECDVCETPTGLVITEMRRAEICQYDVIELHSFGLVNSARTPQTFSRCPFVPENRLPERVFWTIAFLRTKTSQYSEALSMTDRQPVRRVLCDV